MNDNPTEIPDFSGDDFIDDKEVQKLRKEREAYNKMVDQCLTILKQELTLTQSGHKNFKTFHMFKNLEPTTIDTYTSSAFPCRVMVSIAQYGSSYPTGRVANAGIDNYLFGYIELRKEFPSTYVCKETMQQKIINLFVRNDVDFSDHKKFSNKFNVVTKDEKRLESLLRFKNMDHLSAFPELEIEIHGHDCLFRNSRRSISPREATEFSELAKMLANSLAG